MKTLQTSLLSKSNLVGFLGASGCYLSNIRWENRDGMTYDGLPVVMYNRLREDKLMKVKDDHRSKFSNLSKIN